MGQVESTEFKPSSRRKSFNGMVSSSSHDSEKKNDISSSIRGRSPRKSRKEKISKPKESAIASINLDDDDDNNNKNNTTMNKKNDNNSNQNTNNHDKIQSFQTDGNNNNNNNNDMSQKPIIIPQPLEELTDEELRSLLQLPRLITAEDILMLVRDESFSDGTGSNNGKGKGNKKKKSKKPKSSSKVESTTTTATTTTTKPTTTTTTKPTTKPTTTTEHHATKTTPTGFYMTEKDSKETQLAVRINKLLPTELALVRFRLVPRRMKDDVFWMSVIGILKERKADQIAAKKYTSLLADDDKNHHHHHHHANNSYSFSSDDNNNNFNNNKEEKLQQTLRERDQTISKLQSQLDEAKAEIIKLQKQMTQNQKNNLNDGKNTTTTTSTATCSHKGKWIMDADSIEFLEYPDELKENMRREKQKRLEEVRSHMKFILDTNEPKDSYGHWDCCGNKNYVDECGNITTTTD